MHIIVLLLVTTFFLVLSALFLVECVREKEQRATKIVTAALVVFLAMIPIILWIPGLRPFVGILLAILFLGSLLLSFYTGPAG